MMQQPSVEGNFIIIHTLAINLIADFFLLSNVSNELYKDCKSSLVVT